MFESRHDHLKSEVKRLQTVIFECRYQCRIKQRDQYDMDTLINRGIPVTGIDWMDDLADQQDVSRLLTIDQMVEYCDRGVNFWLDDPKAYAGVIYTAITDYIQYYAELADAYPNLPIPDQEDFEKLDGLATNIYRLYRCYEQPREMSGLLGRIAMRRRSFAPQVNLAPKPLMNDDGSIEQKEHKSLLPVLGYRFTPRKEPTNNDH